MPPKAVIFDIGRVIVHINLNRLLEPLAVLRPTGSGAAAAEKLSPEQVWQSIENDPRWQDWQEGRMTPHQWHEHLSRRLRITIGFADFCDAWNRALDPEPILPEELFDRLGATCKLALLSNTDPIHSAHLEACFAFVKQFPVRIYSCSIGASKPSPAIYAAALSALKVPANEALYVDDIAEFAEAARHLGLDAIHFESPAQLRKGLSSRGLLAPLE